MRPSWLTSSGRVGTSGSWQIRNLGEEEDPLLRSVTVEELARVDASHSITVSAHTTLGTSPILYFGTEEQKKRWIPYLAQGRVLGGFGLTEPGAGSDASGTRTRAVRADGGWRISGPKLFITHAGVGEIFVVTAVTDPGQGSRGITSFIVCKPTVDLDRVQALGGGHESDLPFTPGMEAAGVIEAVGDLAASTAFETIDATGLHVYPGLFDAMSTIGLIEIGAESTRIVVRDSAGLSGLVEHAIEQAVVLCQDELIGTEDLPIAPADCEADPLSLMIPGVTLAEVERYTIMKTLEAVGGNADRHLVRLRLLVRCSGALRSG